MLKQRIFRFTAVAAVLAATAGVLYAYPFGPGPGFAGAPGDSTCAMCHGGGAVNTGGGSIELNATTYTPGVDQHVVVTIRDAAAQRWGFEATPRRADNTAAGSLRASDANTQVVSSGSLGYVEHTSAGTRTGTTVSIQFEFDWTPPSSGAGEVTFYVAANAANGNGAADPGDHIYTQSFRLSEASSNGTPSIRANGVVNGASFLAGVSPGAWVSIFGDNLAPGSRNWRDDEIVNDVLPTALDGVSVTIDNKPAYVNYISPGQLNVQVPDDDSPDGEVDVKVTTPNGTAEAKVTLTRAAPAFFTYAPENNKYVAAQHADFSPVGEDGLFGASTESSPAEPGEVIILYGTGFGPTSPATPAGMVIHTAHEIVDKPLLTVQIGGMDATVEYAGVTLAGVWQINVKVPDDVPDGDAVLVAKVGAAQTQANVMLTVAR